MRSIRKRLRLSLQKVADIVGTSADVIRKLEVGDRGLTHEWMVRVAPALECAPIDLISNKESIPVYGILGLRENIRMLDQNEVVELVEAPPGNADSLRALRVVGDDWRPAYKNGDLAYYSPRDKFLSEEGLREECVGMTTRGDYFFATIIPGSESERYHLQLHNGKLIENVEVAWASVILWHKKSVGKKSSE